MMTDRKTCAQGFVVTRQPVFDRKLEPWGTEICFAQSELEEPLFSEESTAGLLLESYLPQRGVQHERTLMYFPAQAVLENVPRLIWPDGLVVEVDEQAARAPGLVEVVAELKRSGYGLAVSGWRNDPACAGLTLQADVICVEAGETGASGALPGLVAAARATGAKVLAGGLMNWESMLHARAAKADMLQGFFFHHMNLRPGVRSMTATQLSRLRLLECLGKPDADFNALARLVEVDAPLAYRLLVFLNSAGFGLGRKVDSISQAIVLAGWQPLQKWLETILMVQLAPSPRHQELCYYAAQRAGFLKRVARVARQERLVPPLALLGLFSYLEAILEMPPAQALEQVPVDDGIRLALCGRKSPYSPWLALVRAMERADWDEAVRLAAGIGLCLTDLSRCYRESFVEADALFRALSAPEPALA